MNFTIRLRNIILITLNILSLIIVYALLFVLGEESSYDWVEITFYLSLICILFNLITLYCLKVKLSDFRFSFILLTYVFMYGRIWLRFFELDTDIFWVLHKLFDPYILLKSGLYVICCTQALFIGLFMLNNRSDKASVLNINTIPELSDNIALAKTAQLLLLIGIPCRLITDINSVISTAATGSYSSITVLSGPVKDFAHLIIPGIICLLEYKPKLMNIVLSSLLFYYLAIMSLTGDRRYYVAGLLSLGSYYFYKYTKRKKISNTFIISGFLLVVLFLNFLQVIRMMRLGGLVSLDVFLENYGFDIFVVNDVVFNVLAEFGISFYSVANIIDNVPSFLPYQYGLSFIKSIPSIIPIGPLFGDIFREASPSTIINAYTNRHVGATLFGDLYANFSIYAVLFCIIIGLGINSIFKSEKLNNSSILIVRYYTSYYILVNLIRCSIFEIMRPIVWCTVIPLITYKLFKR